MRHIRPITKAQLTWFDQSPIQIISALVQLVLAIAPVVTAMIEAKTPEETTS